MSVLAMLAAAGLLANVPSLRLEPSRGDGTAIVAARDARGRVVARIDCPRTPYNTPGDVASRLIGSPIVAATVLAKDGHLTMVEDLGPLKYDCVIVPL
jgi:hypothetical protein